MTETQQTPAPDGPLVQDGTPADAGWPLAMVALMQVKRSLTPIAKDVWNPQGQFKYRGIDQISDMLHPLLCEAGVLPVPQVQELLTETRVTSKDRTMNYARVTVLYAFTAEDGSHIDVITAGEGLDYGDKGLNKAMTNALKNALCQLFQIPTGEAEADAENNEAVPRQAGGRGSGQPEQDEPKMPARNSRGRAERTRSAPTKGRLPADETTPWHTDYKPDQPLTSGESGEQPPQEPPGDPIEQMRQRISAATTEEQLKELRGIVQRAVQGNKLVPADGNALLSAIKVRRDHLLREAAGQGGG